MISYHIASPEVLPIRKRLSGTLVSTVVWLMLFDLLLWWTSSPRRWSDWRSLVIGGVVYFVINLFWKPKVAAYDLEIDDGDGIRLLRGGAIERKVRRDRIRYAREWGSGGFRRLVISEHGPAFTRWFWGGIGVPASLPDYEQIRAEVLTWLQNSKK
jgi:hypothetical protein